MRTEDLLFKVGIPTYKTALRVDLDGEKQPSLAQKAPVNIGWIYGISVNIGGTLPTDQTKNLISLADSGNLWVTFKIGSNDFIDTLKFADLVFQESAVSRSQAANYQSVSIPQELDWNKSYLYNPTGITDKTVLFDFWYIDLQSYQQLLKNKVIWTDGNAPQ